jgi:hypothetical protein
LLVLVLGFHLEVPLEFGGEASELDLPLLLDALDGLLLLLETDVFEFPVEALLLLPVLLLKASLLFLVLETGKKQ